MGRFQKHTNPANNDLLYIIDVDGGVAGRPITKVIEYGNLDLDNNTQIPTTIKTTANDNDFLILFDSNGNPYRITRANFLAGISSSSSPSPTPTPTPNTSLLQFSSFGDNKGMCFWLATRNNTTWTNPHIASNLTVLSSGVAAGSLANIVDRQQGNSNYTVDSPNSWWGIDFKTHKLIPTDVTIRHDLNTGYYLRNFKIQGSNDGTSWTDLNVQTNNTAINSPYAWLRVPITGITVSYRYLRVIMTSTNSSGTWEFCCSELEFYGQIEAI